MRDLHEIESSLDKLHSDFNKQLGELGNDSKDFHSSLIELTAKYPEHKELLQFIVLINDRIETKNSIFSDIVVDSFNDLIETKKLLIKKLIEDKKNKSWYSNFIPQNFKDLKIFVWGIVIIVFGLILLTSPIDLLDALKQIKEINK